MKSSKVRTRNWVKDVRTGDWKMGTRLRNPGPNTGIQTGINDSHFIMELFPLLLLRNK